MGELLEMAEGKVPSGVVDLTKQIKHLQGSVNKIQTKSVSEKASSDAAETKAAQLPPGAAQDSHMKAHITHGAAAVDAEADVESKKKQIVDLTIQQHEAAKEAAVEAHGAAGAKTAAADTDGDADDASGGDVDGGADDSSTDDSTGGDEGVDGGDSESLFGGWLSKYDTTHGNLVAKVEQSLSVTRSIVDGLKAKKSDVHSHMEIVKKAYSKEQQARKAAQQRAKEFKEKELTAKGAEKKAKTAEKSTKTKMQEELEKAKERQTKAVAKKEKQVKT